MLSENNVFDGAHNLLNITGRRMNLRTRECEQKKNPQKTKIYKNNLLRIRRRKSESISVREYDLQAILRFE